MQREEPAEQTNPPLNHSLLADGGHDRMKSAVCSGGFDQLHVSLSECCLPPEDLPLPHQQAPEIDIRKKSHESPPPKESKKKKDNKKKRSKGKKSNIERKSKAEEYQLLPEPESGNQQKGTKQEQRAISESLTGLEVSWSRAYLENAEDLPFREDLVNSRVKSNRRYLRRKLNETKAQVHEVRLNVVEEQTKEQPRALPDKKIALDPDGFPMYDDDSEHSLNVQDFTKPTSAAARKLDISFTPTEISHGGSHFEDSLNSVEKMLADSHLQLQESLTSNENLQRPFRLQDSCASTQESHFDSLIQDSMTETTEMSSFPRNPPESQKANGLHLYLLQQVRDEKVAINTAAAFEAFLRRQHEMTSENCDSDGSSHSWSFKEDDKGCSLSDDWDDPFKHSNFGGSESTLLPCDDDDVKSFREIDEWGSSSFGSVRRNEAFVKRVSSRELFSSNSERTLQSSFIFDIRPTAQTHRSLSTFDDMRDSPEKPGAKALLDTPIPMTLAPILQCKPSSLHLCPSLLPPLQQRKPHLQRKHIIWLCFDCC